MLHGQNKILLGKCEILISLWLEQWAQTMIGVEMRWYGFDEW